MHLYGQDVWNSTRVDTARSDDQRGDLLRGDPRDIGLHRFTTWDRATIVFNIHSALAGDPHRDERHLWEGVR